MFVPREGILCTFTIPLACATQAVVNGAELKLGFRVEEIRLQTVDGRPQAVDPKVFSDEAEQNLYQAFQTTVHRPPSFI